MAKVDLNHVIDRKLLLRKISKWRFLAIFLLLFFIFELLAGDLEVFQDDYVAKIKIEGFISDETYRNDQLANLSEDTQVKAVIIDINSPGGTFVGGERLFNNIKKISASKPTVAVLGNQATSAAYLAALGADYIIASRGTLTGSVGVLLQSAEVSGLAEKIGINPVIIKSDKYKAVPHPAEKIDELDRQYLSKLVEESRDIFLEIVTTNRPDLTEEGLIEVKAGKVFVGQRAKEYNLIDSIGDFDTAKTWLQSKHVVTDNIVNIELQPVNKSIKSLLNGFFIPNMSSGGLKLLAVD